MCEWHGETDDVLVLKDGFRWRGATWHSLSAIAREITGAHWSGPRFFGIAASGNRGALTVQDDPRPRSQAVADGGAPRGNGRARVRCAIYTRKSSEEGLKKAFNSLDAQRETCKAYVLS